MRWFFVQLVGVAAMLCLLQERAAGAVTYGPVAQYQLDGNGNDSSGNNHNGTVVGAIPTQDRSGNPDGAMLFNGTSSYIDVPNAPDLNPTTALTITAWFKANSISQWPAIVKKSDLGSDGWTATGGYTMEIATVYGTPHVSFSAVIDGSTSYAYEPILTGKWYFMAATYDGTTISTYIGSGGAGVLVPDSISAPGSILPSASDLNIGRDPSHPFQDRYFDGAIDDVRIYNRALSAGEINQIYNVPEPSTFVMWAVGTIGLIAYAWRKRRVA